jgi:hypothetical protein
LIRIKKLGDFVIRGVFAGSGYTNRQDAKGAKARRQEDHLFCGAPAKQILAFPFGDRSFSSN